MHSENGHKTPFRIEFGLKTCPLKRPPEEQGILMFIFYIDWADIPSRKGTLSTALSNVGSGAKTDLLCTSVDSY